MDIFKTARPSTSVCTSTTKTTPSLVGSGVALQSMAQTPVSQLDLASAQNTIDARFENLTRSMTEQLANIASLVQQAAPQGNVNDGLHVNAPWQDPNEGLLHTTRVIQCLGQTYALCPGGVKYPLYDGTDSSEFRLWVNRFLQTINIYQPTKTMACIIALSCLQGTATDAAQTGCQWTL